MAINLGQPANKQNPLNRGLQSWHYGITGPGAKLTAFDLAKRKDAVLTSGITRQAVNGSQVLYFNGSDKADLGASYFSSNVLSVSMWAMTTSIASYFCLFSVYTSDSDAMEIFVEPGSGGILFGGNYSNRATTNAGTIFANVPFHVTLTSDGTTTTLYLNGIPYTGTAGTTNFSTFSANAVLGARASGVFFLTGWIDDIRILNRCVSADEAKLLYYSSLMRHPLLLNRTRNSFITTVAAPSGLAANPLYGGGAAAGSLWGYIA